MAPRNKLTGAQAALFAEVCHHYINEAESDCNDRPDDVPIFSQLSRAQRLKLVSDVMIGMLCEDEPLPPDTIQHNSAYRAIILILFTALEVEMDEQWSLYGEGVVGEDLLTFDDPETTSERRSKKEIEEMEFYWDLMELRADKNINKLKKGNDFGDFRVEESTSSSSSQEYRDIFEGGPFPDRERNSVRQLTREEKHAFHWRRLCDAALQDDKVGYPLPASALCNVNFDWRCQKKGKWYKALNILFEGRQGEIYGSLNHWALIHGEINFKSYADPEQLPRIQAIKRNVDLLRKVYLNSWDPKLLAIDVRCIYCVCTTECYGWHHHKHFIAAFFNECARRGIDWTVPGNYQTRLNIFRDIKIDFIDGCEYPFGAHERDDLERIQEDWRPKEEIPFDFGLGCGRKCHGPGTPNKLFPQLNGHCYESEDLQSCSSCKAVLYCSRACQVADWKRGHKKVCKRLAEERKDKAKIAEMAKKY